MLGGLLSAACPPQRRIAGGGGRGRAADPRDPDRARRPARASAPPREASRVGARARHGAGRWPGATGSPTRSPPSTQQPPAHGRGADAGRSALPGRPRSRSGVRTGNPGARLTVAWELTWYQWEVGPGPGGPEVRESGKGETIDQLRAADRTWNLLVGRRRHARAAGRAGRPRPARRRVKLTVHVDGGRPRQPRSGRDRRGDLATRTARSSTRPTRRSAARRTTSPSTGR